MGCRSGSGPNNTLFSLHCSLYLNDPMHQWNEYHSCLSPILCSLFGAFFVAERWRAGGLAGWSNRGTWLFGSLS